jgi:hypothetical protein
MVAGALSGPYQWPARAPSPLAREHRKAASGPPARWGVWQPAAWHRAEQLRRQQRDELARRARAAGATVQLGLGARWQLRRARALQQPHASALSRGPARPAVSRVPPRVPQPGGDPRDRPYAGRGPPERPRCSRNGSLPRSPATRRGRAPPCLSSRAHVRARRHGSSSPTASSVLSWFVLPEGAYPPTTRPQGRPQAFDGERSDRTTQGPRKPVPLLSQIHASCRPGTQPRSSPR